MRNWIGVSAFLLITVLTVCKKVISKKTNYVIIVVDNLMNTSNFKQLSIMILFWFVTATILFQVIPPHFYLAIQMAVLTFCQLQPFITNPALRYSQKCYFKILFNPTITFRRYCIRKLLKMRPKIPCMAMRLILQNLRNFVKRGNRINVQIEI